MLVSLASQGKVHQEVVADHQDKVTLDLQEVDLVDLEDLDLEDQEDKCVGHHQAIQTTVDHQWEDQVDLQEDSEAHHLDTQCIAVHLLKEDHHALVQVVQIHWAVNENRVYQFCTS